MIAKSPLVMVFVTIIKLSAASAQEGATGDCPSGTLFEPQRGICAQVRDMRDSFPPGPAKIGAMVVPNLAELRAAGGGAGQESGPPPAPGWAAGGTFYNANRLPSRREAALYTEMFVYPNGIGDLSDWIFTTALNHMDKSIEVVGIYKGSGTGSLGVWDWSCMPDYPCPNNEPGPSWQWTRDLAELSCYYTMKDDGGGHQHNLLYYVNRSFKIACGNPPSWENSVLLWNYCSDGFDYVYHHTFALNQWPCDVTDWDCQFGSLCPEQGCCPYGCAWGTGGWGPSIESFITGAQPQIKELGFFNTWFLYDGVWSAMGPDDTHWLCPFSPWQVFHRDPNRSWGVGSFTGN